MFKNKSVNKLFAFHLFLILILLLTIILKGIDYQELILRDDGYYNISKDFVNGHSLFHKFRGPVLPLIFSVLFLFPLKIQPFIRILITLIFSYGVLLILYNITKDYLSKKQFLIGGLIFIFNPVWIHWTFKSSPEIYLCFFLGLFIYFILQYYKTTKIKYILFSLLVFFLSFFIKPVFLFIPIIMLFFSIIFVKSKKIIIISIIFAIAGIGSYIIQDNITKLKYDLNLSKVERTYEYVHKTFLVSDTFWTDYVIKTKQFHKGRFKKYTIAYRNDLSLKAYIEKWRKNFFDKFPNKGLIFMNLYFVYNEPLLVFQKFIASPFFYFAMSARTWETFLKLINSIILITLSIIGLKKIIKKSSIQVRKEILLILSIVIGYIVLHLLTHSMNRYSLPVLPYLYVWAGLLFGKGIPKDR